MPADACPFCDASPERILGSNDHAIAIPDGYPVADGHTLVVPRRHVNSLFDLSSEERAAVWALADEVRQQLFERFRPDGFNVGLNDGLAAGQTVDHAHVHVIPRFEGDVPDPKGGVRWVIPVKADYWSVP
jgi:diadenosine tetraphosphate (Ap4A) HIT family hydrolase